MKLTNTPKRIIISATCKYCEAHWETDWQTLMERHDYLEVEGGVRTQCDHCGTFIVFRRTIISVAENH